MTNGTDGGADREMTENETPPRDNRQTMIIVLGVVLVILVGLIVGFIVSGGSRTILSPPRPPRPHRPGHCRPAPAFRPRPSHR